MKTTKLIAVALILGIASLGYAQTEKPADQAPNGTTPQSVVIPLKKAMHSPDLNRAMHAQLNDNFLQVDKPLYTVPVRIRHTVVYVSGTLVEWTNFFRSDATDSAKTKRNLIPLDKAMQEAQLVQAMRAQLSPRMLNEDKELYIASVRYTHTIVYVAGTYIQWKKFFSIATIDKPRD